MSEIKIGRYEIRDELGEGGMGTVYLARDPNLGRDVALKVLHPHLFSHDPAFSLRFEQEARTIAALEHSHIVPLYEFGEDSNGLYFVMRLMKGGTLRDKLAQGPLTLNETIAILERVGSALDKAHRSGIVHRDLKPGNILFDEDNNAFLGDFGIVKTADTDRLKTRTGQALGTPHYMSPEQVDGKELDGRSDIYALGVIFYEMVTGVRPYDHETSTVRVMAMHLAAPIPSLLEANPDLPPQLEAVLQKVMAKAPADRYNTAHEMITAIKAATAATAPTQILSEPQVPASPSHTTDAQSEPAIAKSKPSPVPSAEIDPQKATSMMAGPLTLEKAGKQLGVFVTELFKPDEETQKPSYWKAIGRHLLFGFGLFYVDNQLERKWIHAIAAITTPIAYYIAISTQDSNYYAIASYAAVVSLVSACIWLLSFLDVLLTCRNRRRDYSPMIIKPADVPQETYYWKALGWHLILGFGLFYVDNRLERKWIYPGFAIIAAIAYLANAACYPDYLCDVYKLYEPIFWFSLCLWLSSFVDVILTCRNQRQPLPPPNIKAVPKKPSYWKAIAWHLFLGFGLFYVDKRLKRRWIYVLSIVAILLAIGLAGSISYGIGLYGYDIDARYYGGDIISDSTATLIFYIGIGIYFVGFLDTLLTCRSYRHRT